MKRFFKILKLIFATLLTLFSAAIIYLLLFSPTEKRYDSAAHLQGSFLSQSLFEILKFQDPEIYFEQSVAFNKRGDYKKGFELLDQAVELNSKAHLGYRGYMKLRFLRDFNGALKDFNRLDSLTPNFVDAPWSEDINFLRGESYFGLEDYEKAKSYFEKSIETQGENWVDIQAFVYAGICEYKMDKPVEAITFYKKALEQSKYTVEAHLGLAKIYLEIDDLENAKLHSDLAQKYYTYKRTDPYNEYLNEVYKNDIEQLKSTIIK
ncbi:tetratricopeptide repeat protein [Salegentibacter sp. LM13S]|uniref:tetratricopeptide repeat protein n=1 Tax=Salegentibacter lacus TaxID=2873599 RepID=UPI001CCC14A0|nr:tetratricopeptide repeat protein [Salegentibacter lacus]MBZ9629149.1 tetratricopeptide repeat protein [Salegentibacter lacus]